MREEGGAERECILREGDKIRTKEGSTWSNKWKPLIDHEYF